MPTFAYEALNAAGKPQKGTIDANSTEEAIQRIKGQGFFPTAVREQKTKKGPAAPDGSKPLAKKRKSGGISIGGVGAKQMTTFTRQLSTLQDAAFLCSAASRSWRASRSPAS